MAPMRGATFPRMQSSLCRSHGRLLLEIRKMKTKIALGLALAVALSTSAFAATKHHVAVETDNSASYGQPATERYYSPRSDVVMFGNRVIGQDPDLNIRSQMEHDPVPSEN